MKKLVMFLAISSIMISCCSCEKTQTETSGSSVSAVSTTTLAQKENSILCKVTYYPYYEINKDNKYITEITDENVMTQINDLYEQAKQECVPITLSENDERGGVDLLSVTSDSKSWAVIESDIEYNFQEDGQYYQIPDNLRNEMIKMLKGTFENLSDNNSN